MCLGFIKTFQKSDRFPLSFAYSYLPRMRMRTSRLRRLMSLATSHLYTPESLRFRARRKSKVLFIVFTPCGILPSSL